MEEFSLHYLNDGKWSIKNSNQQWWTDSEGWVSPTSSYWGSSPDCYNKLFSFDELNDFLIKHYSFDMKDQIKKKKKRE